jgi:GH15 family glucan-1,4-alpha-glucosidase
MNLPFRIDDYGLIGDGRSAALVSRGGSIDWLCWPRFDSAAVFAAVLDPDKGGTFRVASATPSRVTRRYLESTNVLCTSFASRTGTLRVTDFMPVSSEEAKKTALFAEHEIVRIIECEAGEVDVEIAFAPRPGYARRRASLRAYPTLGVRLEQGRDLYTLRSDAPLELRDSGTAVARFSLRAGERRHACLTYDRDGPAVLPPIAPRCHEALERTLAFWRAWTARSTYDGPYRDAIERSVLALKLLSFAPSGAIVAAPTTSLPERVGGDLNWDYRFCWLRDASLTEKYAHMVQNDLRATIALFAAPGNSVVTGS